jgi:hypothetical protein
MQYNYRKEQRERIWDYLTEKEKLQIQNQQKKDDRAYNESKDNLSISKSWAEKAIDNGQANIAAQIANLNPKDPAFQTKLSELTGKISILTPEQKSAKDYVSSLATTYPDAGILLTDDISTAQAKLKNSAIYRDKIRPPSRGTQTERDRVLITDMLSKARPQLESSREGGQFIDGNEFLKLRSDYISVIGNAKAFDDAFVPLLSPEDRIKYFREYKPSESDTDKLIEGLQNL